MASKKANTSAPAPVPADQFSLEAKEILVELPTVTQFLKKLGAFYDRAKELEVSAIARRNAALHLPAPANATEDELIQIAIKDTNAAKKALADHWTITAVVHKIHRRLTGRRKIAEDALDGASTRLNELHNRFVAEEKRKAREAQERIEREERERAERERQAELDRLAREAEEAEASSPDLSAREREFVRHFAAKNNAAEAARLAGYKAPSTKGPQLLTYTKILDALEALRKADALRQQAEAEARRPLEVDHVEVQPAVTKVAGAVSRTTWSAEVVDEAKLIAAVLDPWARKQFSLPEDIVKIDRVKLNEYARSLHEQLDRWPGVKAVSSTKLV